MIRCCWAGKPSVDVNELSTEINYLLVLTGT